MIWMKVRTVAMDQQMNPVVLLVDQAETLALPIWIGTPEAQSIALELQGVKMPRPMTHDLMRDVLTELGVVLDHVVITELKDQTFYAELRLRRGGTSFVVSARPSDAIALAVRAGATIYAEEALLDAEGIVISQAEEGEDRGEGDELVAQFHEFLEGVRPEDFDK